MLNTYADHWTLAICMDLTNLAFMELRIKAQLHEVWKNCDATGSSDGHSTEKLEHLVRLLEKIEEKVAIVQDLIRAELTRKW